MMNNYGPFWGMHLFWWAFWIFMMISLFSYNIPERVGINSLDPLAILRRRLAKGQITEEEFKRLTEQLRSDEQGINRDTAAQSIHLKVPSHLMVDGLSISVTWCVFYSLCSLLFWIAPDVITTATSKLFHGMNFTQMAQTGTTFGFGDYFSVLTIGAVYMFATGIIWSFVHSFFLGQRAERKLKQLKEVTLEK